MDVFTIPNLSRQQVFTSPKALYYLLIGKLYFAWLVRTNLLWEKPKHNKGEVRWAVWLLGGNSFFFTFFFFEDFINLVAPIVKPWPQTQSP